MVSRNSRRLFALCTLGAKTYGTRLMYKVVVTSRGMPCGRRHHSWLASSIGSSRRNGLNLSKGESPKNASEVAATSYVVLFSLGRCT